MTVLDVRTAAKVNLCLRVLGRRADGYHEVETVLHTVGVWDRLRIEEAESDQIEVTIAEGEAPEGQDNLCWRAGALLAERAKVKRGAAIRIWKTIPQRSGLGGGSSDAAAALAGLSRLWGLRLAPDELEAIAAEVGADVPFFLRGGCCLARGRGEKLAPAPTMSAWLVIVAPPRGVSTPHAYAALARGATRGHRRAPSRPVQRLLDALKAGDPEAVGAALHNDFESAKIAAVAEALQAKADLLSACPGDGQPGCLGAAMSGSGSAVFAIARDRTVAEQAAEDLRGRWPWVAVARTLAGSESLVIDSGEAG